MGQAFVEKTVEIGRSLPPLAQLLLFVGAWLLAWAPLAWWIGRRIGWQFPAPPSPAQKLPLVLSLYLLLPLPLGAYARLQGRGLLAQLEILGWRWDGLFLRQVGLGLAIALVGLALLWGLERTLGWLHFQIDGKRLLALALPILLVALLVSAVEETLFRGVMPQVFAAALPDGLAIALRAGLAIASANIVFALLHLPWEPLRTGLPQLPGLWVMGCVLALSVNLTGDLALAIGLHGGWVWAIASLDAIEGLDYSGKAPAWVTGLNGNLVAGAMGMAFLVATGLGLIGLTVGF